MNLYLIYQTENNDYYTYDSAVVAAETVEEAQRIHPDGQNNDWTGEGPSYDWCKSPKDVSVELLGKAGSGTEKGVVIASFHAG